jgi:hypothetical protein
MKVDFDKYKGSLPYASELFGVFQPLIGWRSRRVQDRLHAEAGNNLAQLVRMLKNRSSAYTTDSGAQLGHVYEESAFQIAVEIDGLLARLIAQVLDINKEPTADEWRQIFTLEAVNRYLQGIEAEVRSFSGGKIYSTDVEMGSYLQHQLEIFVLKSLTGDRTYQAKDDVSATRVSIAILKDDPSKLSAFMDMVLEREKRIAQSLMWLAQTNPSSLNKLFFQKNPLKLANLAKFIDPLQNFGESTLEAVLSPVGIIHIFRQYFFEFDTFLGPAVGHVWISPGGTVELVEVSTRKTLIERSVETSEESTQKREQETKLQDELADAVKDENRNDLKFGFGASAQYSTVVFEAEANTSLDFESSRTSSRETTHKQLREQSEKLSEEIKRSFKSTFKVTTSVEDFSSKRYVIQNTTDKLVNYEMRRKMRQVGVQLQDINTQLSWQVYVDDPGRELGIAKLIHIAQPANLSALQPPQAPVHLPKKPLEVMIQFPYENTPDSEGSEMDVTFYNGDDHEGGVFSNNDKIIWVRDFTAEPPAPGYTLDTHIDLQINHSSTVAASVERINAQGKFRISLNQVNFDNQPFINIKATTYWNPPDQSAADAAYQAQVAEYNAEKSRLEKEAYIKSAQERINIASKVQARKFEELREEERIVVYRKLIGQLMNVGDAGSSHITSELIRSIFDVDNMLYFVAPEWWRSRLHQSHQTLGTVQPITEENIVSWGGMGENREDNYFITGESVPAPLGSSLGWLLQLDGDNFRNAFLNSPWVKAVIPIRPGKETDALNWLQQAHVEGADGLDAEYQAYAEELLEIKPDGSTVTLRDALDFLAKKIKQQHDFSASPQQSPFEPQVSIPPGEVVYEHGFNPLAGGVKVDEEPFRVFSQWIEVLPTDQVVALEYNANEHL